jgi:VIT1/CCC1 family predicted Fe2+/Mn2+ transporter
MTTPDSKPGHAAESWYEEMRSAWLYRVIAECEAGTPREALFRELAEAAEAQAHIWLEAIRRRGEAAPAGFRPDLRTRVVARLVRLFGPRAMRRVLAAMKVRGMSLYSTGTMPHRIPSRLEEIGQRHRNAGSGNLLRAAVFGVNDGLVSNASLIYGVAGASPEPSVIVLTGVAGMLAGAFSMAAGEYVSVRSQREMFEYQIGLEREELDEYPQEEAAELALIYEAKGVSKDEARRMAEALIQDPERALDTLAREELGLNPEDLGSPLGAAGSSFLSFIAGAVLPLLPFLFLSGSPALELSIAVTALGLFGVGAALSLFTGRQAIVSGLRMLLIGGTAGLATYFIGKLMGVTLG